MVKVFGYTDNCLQSAQCFGSAVAGHVSLLNFSKFSFNNILTTRLKNFNHGCSILIVVELAIALGQLMMTMQLQMPLIFIRCLGNHSYVLLALEL